MAVQKSLIFMGSDLPKLYEQINTFIANTHVLFKDVRVKAKNKGYGDRYFATITYEEEDDK